MKDKRRGLALNVDFCQLTMAAAYLESGSNSTPTLGTAAHSYIAAYDSEQEAFENHVKIFPESASLPEPVMKDGAPVKSTPLPEEVREKARGKPRATA